MSQSFRSLLAKACLFVLMVGVLMLASFTTFADAYKTVGAWISYFVFSLTTLVSLLIFEKYKNIESKNFFRLLLGVNGGKFFLILFFLLIYVFFSKENRLHFLLTVLVQYFIFTIFELATLLRLVRSQSGQNIRK